jgi:hypothetical protein
MCSRVEYRSSYSFALPNRTTVTTCPPAMGAWISVSFDALAKSGNSRRVLVCGRNNVSTCSLTKHGRS